MDATAPRSTTAGSPGPDLVTAWPRTAQWALALLLALAVLLIAVQALGSLRWGTRPSRLERAAEQTAVIDLNTADQTLLMQLPEVGEKLAGAIVEYRRANGGFRSVDELRKVHGVGRERMRLLRPYLYLSEGPPGEPATRPVSLSSPSPATRPANRPKKGEDLTHPIDINSATAEELQKLPGIGPVLAGRIIEAREAAPFRSVDDLLRVRGIGPKTLEKVRPHVTVGEKPKRVA